MSATQFIKLRRIRMKVGETKIILVDCEEVSIDLVDKAIFTIKGADSVTKAYPGDDVSFSDGKFLINLFQEDTLKLSSGSRVYCEIEGQIVYKDKSVAKTNTELFALDRTLATELIDGNKPSATDIQNVKLEIVGDVIIAKVEGGVTPEQVKPIVEEVIEDKNLASKSDIPTKVSELENDADLVNKAYVDDSISITKSEFSEELSSKTTMADVEAKGYQTEAQTNALIDAKIEALGYAESEAY